MKITTFNTRWGIENCLLLKVTSFYNLVCAARKHINDTHGVCVPSCYLRMQGRARYIPLCVWIMTEGFTGRCHGDEECQALAHATKRCLMGSRSYDNNDKLGLTGQHDDGPPLKLRRAARHTVESAHLDADWSLGVC